MNYSQKKIILSREIPVEEIKSEIFCRLSLFENLPINAEISSDFSLFCQMQADEIKELIEALPLKDVECDA